MIKFQSLVFYFFILEFERVNTTPPPAPAPPLEPCPCHWVEIWEPICGDDHHTYSNGQELSCKNFCYKKTVRIAHTGCCDDDSSPCDPPAPFGR